MRKAETLTAACAVVTKYGNLNFLEPSGPFQACFTFFYWKKHKFCPYKNHRWKYVKDTDPSLCNDSKSSKRKAVRVRDRKAHGAVETRLYSFLTWRYVQMSLSRHVCCEKIVAEMEFIYWLTLNLLTWTIWCTKNAIK